MISGHEPRRAPRARLAAALCLAVWTVPAAADDFESILEAIETPRDVPIPFVEKRGNALLAEPLVLTGEAEFGADGTLSKSIETPFRERVVITRDMLELTRDGRTRRLSLQRKDDVRQFYAALRALLEGDAQTLRELFTIETARNADCWRLVLVPAAEPLAAFVGRMVVSGRSSRVLEVRTEHAADDWQSLSFGGAP
ncbi:MAG TPA: LolA-related protein [Gammaproteobacteria bacterium]|nr:LolA-related protein [Gammaproteobacteria bacterium]